MIEKMVLEEFGRCLLSIIHTANGTKGKFCRFFAFWFQLLLHPVSFCVFLLASLLFLTRGYQGGSWRKAKPQSQSKLLGHCAVFLPSQCCCARYGELTAITNNGGTGQKWKNRVGWKCSNYFCLRLRLFHSTVPSKSPPPPHLFVFKGK